MCVCVYKHMHGPVSVNVSSTVYSSHMSGY